VIRTNETQISVFNSSTDTIKIVLALDSKLMLKF